MVPFFIIFRIIRHRFDQALIPTNLVAIWRFRFPAEYFNLSLDFEDLNHIFQPNRVIHQTFSV